MLKIFYCQHVCIFNHEKHCRNVLPCNVSQIYNVPAHLTILLYRPPRLLILNYSHDLKLISNPIY